MGKGEWVVQGILMAFWFGGRRLEEEEMGDEEGRRLKKGRDDGVEGGE